MLLFDSLRPVKRCSIGGTSEARPGTPDDWQNSLAGFREDVAWPALDPGRRAMDTCRSPPDVVPSGGVTAGPRARRPGGQTGRRPSDLPGSSHKQDPMCGAGETAYGPAGRRRRAGPAVCFLCGEALRPAWPLAARPGPAEPSVAEALSAAAGRRLRAAADAAVCAACRRLLDQSRRPGPLQKTAARHLRGLLRLRLEAPDRRRTGVAGPGRPRAGARRGQVAVFGGLTVPGDVTMLDESALDQVCLDTITDLTVPSGTKRSARIAIRRNVALAAAAHATPRRPIVILPPVKHGEHWLPMPAMARKINQAADKEPEETTEDPAEPAAELSIRLPPAAWERSPCREEDVPEAAPRLADPACPCVLCAPLTEEQRQRLAERSAAGADPAVRRCPGCRRQLTGEAAFSRHQRRCRRQRRQRADLQPEAACVTCGARFGTLKALSEHQSAAGHERRRACPVCRRLFNADFLRTHLASHAGAFLCRVCRRYFSSGETLAYHMNRHSGARPFKCADCGAGFRSPSMLFMHRRRRHLRERPYPCSACPRRFAAKAELVNHARQHTGERPFACRLCAKAYPRKASLTQHLRSHTQQRPYGCLRCGKRFITKTHQTEHANMHLGLRPHGCADCGRAFASKNKLGRHRRLNCHGAPPPPPDEAGAGRPRRPPAPAGRAGAGTAPVSADAGPGSGPVSVGGDQVSVGGDLVSAVEDPVCAGGDPVSAGGDLVSAVEDPVSAGGDPVSAVENPVSAG